MNKIEALLDKIISNNVCINEIKTLDIKTVSIKTDDKKDIFIDKTKFINSKDLYVQLAHEFLHCEYDIFYNIDSSLQTRKRREYKIDKIMIQELVPIEKLKSLSKYELNQYELSEEFDVPEETIELAFKIYKNMGVL
mgnify:CR=1 FL=1